MASRRPGAGMSFLNAKEPRARDGAPPPASELGIKLEARNSIIKTSTTPWPRVAIMGAGGARVNWSARWPPPGVQFKGMPASQCASREPKEKSLASGRHSASRRAPAGLFFPIDSRAFLPASTGCRYSPTRGPRLTVIDACRGNRVIVVHDAGRDKKLDFESATRAPITFRPLGSNDPRPVIVARPFAPARSGNGHAKSPTLRRDSAVFTLTTRSCSLLSPCNPKSVSGGTVLASLRFLRRSFDSIRFRFLALSRKAPRFRASCPRASSNRP